MDYIVTNRPDYFDFPNFCSVEDCVGILENSYSIGYDSETTSLSFADGVLRTMQFSDGTDNFIVDIEGGIKPTEFKEILESKELIGQNLQFDIPFLYVFNIIPNKLWDSLLAEQSLTLGIKAWKRDLGSLLENYLDVTIPKDLQDKMTSIPLNDPDAIEYMFNDVRHLHKLQEAMFPLLRDVGVEKAHKLYCRFARVAAYIEFGGIKKDNTKLERIYREYEAKEWFAENELNQYLLENTDVDPWDFNWSSAKQVGELLKKLGYNIKWRGKETVDIKVLGKRYKKDPLISKYIEYKKRNKIVTTYGRSWGDLDMPDGLIHTKLKSLGAETGRTSSGDARHGKFPNIQNLPTEGDFRKIFKPRNARFTFVDLDYSQQEGIIMGEYSQDPKMIEFFSKDGADIHSFNAQQVWHKELGHLSLEEIKENHKDYRQLSKALSFTLNFGGGAFAFADSADISEEEAQAIIDKYFERFSGLKEYKDKVTQEALEKGYVLISKVTGAKRFIENFDYYKMNKYDNKNVESFVRTVEKMALNTPIQGTAAEISKTAGILIFDWIISSKNFKKIWISNFIHDEYLIEVPKAKAEELSLKLKELMELAGTYFLKTLKLKAEPHIGDIWEH